MAVSISQELDGERGVFYEITLSASGDVAQAALISNHRQPNLDWSGGKVGWWKADDVTATFTNAGSDAMVIDASGNGTLDNWVDHPDDGENESAETLPVTGLRFEATGADQTVLLYTGSALDADPVDAGTPA